MKAKACEENSMKTTARQTLDRGARAVPAIERGA